MILVDKPCIYAYRPGDTYGTRGDWYRQPGSARLLCRQIYDALLPVNPPGHHPAVFMYVNIIRRTQPLLHAER
jgi:hypothetical protein